MSFKKFVLFSFFLSLLFGYAQSASAGYQYYYCDRNIESCRKTSSYYDSDSDAVAAIKKYDDSSWQYPTYPAYYYGAVYVWPALGQGYEDACNNWCDALFGQKFYKCASSGCVEVSLSSHISTCKSTTCYTNSNCNNACPLPMYYCKYDSAANTIGVFKIPAGTYSNLSECTDKQNNIANGTECSYSSSDACDGYVKPSSAPQIRLYAGEAVDTSSIKMKVGLTSTGDSSSYAKVRFKIYKVIGSTLYSLGYSSYQNLQEGNVAVVTKSGLSAGTKYCYLAEAENNSGKTASTGDTYSQMECVTTESSSSPTGNQYYYCDKYTSVAKLTPGRYSSTNECTADTSLSKLERTQCQSSSYGVCNQRFYYCSESTCKYTYYYYSDITNCNSNVWKESGYKQGTKCQESCYNICSVQTEPPTTTKKKYYYCIKDESVAIHKRKCAITSYSYSSVTECAASLFQHHPSYFPYTSCAESCTDVCVINKPECDCHKGICIWSVPDGSTTPKGKYWIEGHKKSSPTSYESFSTTYSAESRINTLYNSYKTLYNFDQCVEQAQKMYYCDRNQKKCVATDQQYNSIESCQDNLVLFGLYTSQTSWLTKEKQQTTGYCYTSYSNCNAECVPMYSCFKTTSSDQPIAKALDIIYKDTAECQNAISTSGATYYGKTNNKCYETESQAISKCHKYLACDTTSGLVSTYDIYESQFTCQFNLSLYRSNETTGRCFQIPNKNESSNGFNEAVGTNSPYCQKYAYCAVANSGVCKTTDKYFDNINDCSKEHGQCYPLSEKDTTCATACGKQEQYNFKFYTFYPSLNKCDWVKQNGLVKQFLSGSIDSAKSSCNNFIASDSSTNKICYSEADKAKCTELEKTKDTFYYCQNPSAGKQCTPGEYFLIGDCNTAIKGLSGVIGECYNEKDKTACDTICGKTSDPDDKDTYYHCLNEKSGNDCISEYTTKLDCESKYGTGKCYTNIDTCNRELCHKDDPNKETKFICPSEKSGQQCVSETFDAIGGCESKYGTGKCYNDSIDCYNLVCKKDETNEKEFWFYIRPDTANNKDGGCFQIYTFAEQTLCEQEIKNSWEGNTTQKCYASEQACKTANGQQAMNYYRPNVKASILSIIIKKLFNL